MIYCSYQHMIIEFDQRYNRKEIKMLKFLLLKYIINKQRSERQQEFKRPSCRQRCSRHLQVCVLLSPC